MTFGSHRSLRQNSYLSLLSLDFSDFFGGELGIRTLGTFLYTAFRVLHLRPLGQLSVYVIPHFFQKHLERTDGKNNKIFNFRTEEKPEFVGFFSGGNSQLCKKFRVMSVMTTSIRLRILVIYLVYCTCFLCDCQAKLHKFVNFKFNP